MEQRARYHVVFYGELAEGQQAEDVKSRLATMFRLSPKRIETVFDGKPLMIKENVGRNEALKYKRAFERSGARCRIVPIKRKIAQSAPPPSPKTQKPEAIVRPKKQHSQQLFFNSDIPQEQLEKAIQSYARAFRQGDEHALLLLDLNPSGGALLLSDRRLYLRRVNGPPRTIKLTGIRSVDFKEKRILINKQPLLSLPDSLQEKALKLVEVIKSAAKEAALHPVEEEPLTPETEKETKDGKRNAIKIAIAAAVTIVILGVGFRLLWPSKQQEESPPVQVATETTGENPASEKPQAVSEPVGVDASPASCQRYEYSIKSGQSSNLEFIQAYQVPGKELKLEEAASTYELEDDELQEYGGHAVMAGPYMTTIQVWVWAVDGTSMYQTLRNLDWCQYIDEEKRWNERPPCIPKTHKWSDFAIEWKPDGYGIITRFDKVFGMMNIAKLSEETISEKFASAGGFSPIISYGVGDANYLRNGGIATHSEVNLSVLRGPIRSMEETFSLSITRYAMDVHLQNFPVTISAPNSTKLNGGHITKDLKFLPSNGTGPELKLKVKISASGDVKVYGPKLREECF